MSNRTKKQIRDCKVKEYHKHSIPGYKLKCRRYVKCKMYSDYAKEVEKNDNK